MGTSRNWVIASTLSVLAAAAGATALHYGGAFLPGDDRSPNVLQASANGPTGAGTPGALPNVRDESVQPYIVVFGEPALSSYRGERQGLAEPARMNRQGERRLDVRGFEARQYVSFLQSAQRGHESRIANAIGRRPEVTSRMQHALNAVVMKLSEREAARISRDSGVTLVEAYREVAFDTDVGPRLIGAEPVWNGTVPGFPTRYQGEGVVIGVIDSGINHDSPSFAAIDPIDGFTHVNPLGAGVYLGSCAAGGADAGKCNDKLIGGYDFVCAAPSNTCGLPNIREEPGFNDTNGHGSHTASTAAGNRRNAQYKGQSVRISGVAPRANVIAYDACYTNTAGQGLCPNTATVASVNQAVADGVVDVINYSIGGGASPWTDAVSLAFLNASDAGIYVAASAGNSGPGPNTMGHHEPWVGSTAAAQHGRADYSFIMQVTGPAPVPTALQTVPLGEGAGGVLLANAIPPTTRLIVSARIDTTSDGCNASPFAAGSLTGSMVMIRRGGCPFAEKTNNATAAGAIAVVIANNQVGAIAPSVPGTTIPVFSVTQAEGNAIRDFSVGNGNTTTVALNFPRTAIPNVADALAAFSSRGPAGSFALLKPDITAPGVNVIAAYAVASATADDSQLVAAISGTSMASPHHAGAAALLRQAHPTWSVPEIKSALMLTAKQEVFLEDQVTPANPFAKGAGRVQVNDALRAGLVMHETTANYRAANPGAAMPGDPTRLNQPSLLSTNCFSTCTFQRTVRNTLSFTQGWSGRVLGLRGSVSPSSFSLAPGQSRTISVTVITAGVPANDAFSFGTLELRPLSTGNVNQPTLRMPMAVTVPSPMIGLPSSISAAVAPNSTTQLPFSVSNIGGGFLNFNYVMSGIAPVLLQNPLEFVTGFASTRFSDPSAAGRNARFAADDVVLAGPTQVTQLTADGFTGGGAAVTTATAQSVRWSLYPDAGGLPAGNPESAPDAAVWTYSSALNGPGISQSGNRIILNLAAASTSLMLPAGRYWLIVNTVGTTSWFHLRSTGSAAGQPGIALIDVSTTGTGSWIADPAVGLTISLTGTVACGAPWLTGMTPASGSIAGRQFIAAEATVNSTGLAAGSYSSFLCIDSNDSLRPRAATPVRLTVNP